MPLESTASENHTRQCSCKVIDTGLHWLAYTCYDILKLFSRSQLLLDQYRKKASLYKSNSVLIPLGDDFRYTTAEEWDAQYTNYQAIFDYVNAHPELNAEMSFGTLQDYFDSVRNASLLRTRDSEGLFKVKCH